MQRENDTTGAGLRLLTVVCTVIVALVVPPAASARKAPQPKRSAAAGQLDRSFGRGGRATAASPPERERSRSAALLSLPAPVGKKVASAPGGKLVAVRGPRIFEFSNDGALDHEFGGDGIVRIAPPEGFKFLPAAIAVDSRGRILVAGTTASATSDSTPGPPEYPGALGPPLQWASVYRYLPNGQRDPEFATGGLFTSTFDRLPPTGPGPFDYRYGSASVGVLDLAIGADGAPILAGYYASHVEGGCTPPQEAFLTHAYIAHLDSDGSLDQGFGERGVVADEQVESVRGLATNGLGQILYASSTGGQCGFRGPAMEQNFVSLLGDGQLNPSFGTGGGPLHPPLSVRSIAFDRQGRLLVLGDRVLLGETQEEQPGIRRLLPNGSPDPSFGHDGSVAPNLPAEAELLDLAVDGRGRVLLAGRLSGTFSLRPAIQRSEFLVTRLSAAGEVDHGFGHNGFVESGFGRGTSATADEIIVDGRGRIVAAGSVKSPDIPGHHGIAVARYLSDH